MINVMRPMDNASDSPSYVAPDALRPDVGATPTRGAAPASHPELAQGHRDNRLVAIADLTGESSVGHGTSAADVLRARAPASQAASAELVPK